MLSESYLVPTRVTSFPLKPVYEPYSTQGAVDVLHGNATSNVATRITLFVQAGPLSERWNLIKPLDLVVEYEAGNYLVSESIFGMYGIGNTSQTAVKDFFASLIEYYELVQEQVNDEPANQMLLTHLSQYIERH